MSSITPEAAGKALRKHFKDAKTFKENNSLGLSRNKFEKWSTLGDFSSYLVSSSGRIWSKRSKKYLKATQHPYTGYMKIKLKRDSDGHAVTLYLHRLIASVFLPNLEDKPEVNHRDGNKKNNSVWNLEWVTKEENQRHAQIHGLGNVKLKPIEVENIFYLAWASDMTQEEIGNLYGVRRSIVSDIKNRKAWEFVTDFKVQHDMGLFE